MACEEQIWVDAVAAALADVRAMLACFGLRDRDLEFEIDQAMALAQLLKTGTLQP
jgi:hypothetical protein